MPISYRPIIAMFPLCSVLGCAHTPTTSAISSNGMRMTTTTIVTERPFDGAPEQIVPLKDFTMLVPATSIDSAQCVYPPARPGDNGHTRYVGVAVTPSDAPARHVFIEFDSSGHPIMYRDSRGDQPKLVATDGGPFVPGQPYRMQDPKGPRSLVMLDYVHDKGVVSNIPDGGKESGTYTRVAEVEQDPRFDTPKHVMAMVWERCRSGR